MTRCARDFLWCLFILFSFYKENHALSIEQFAVPSAVPSSENAELQCRYTLDPAEPEGAVVVKWWWRPLHAGLEDRVVIYQRIGQRTPQALRDDVVIGEHDSLVLQTLSPADSGTYECEVAVVDETRQSQLLVVYSEGTGPQLNASIVPAEGEESDAEGGEAVLVTCEARDAAPKPELVITVNQVVQTASHYLTDPSDGQYNVTSNTTLPIDKVKGAEIRCELFFTDEQVAHPAYVSVLTDFEILGLGGASTETPIDVTDGTTIADNLPDEDNSSSVDLRSTTAMMLVTLLMRLM